MYIDDTAMLPCKQAQVVELERSSRPFRALQSTNLLLLLGRPIPVPLHQTVIEDTTMTACFHTLQLMNSCWAQSLLGCGGQVDLSHKSRASSTAINTSGLFSISGRWVSCFDV